MYGRHTDVWECINVLGNTGIWGDALGHTDVRGMYRHTGGIQMYRGVQIYWPYRHMGKVGGMRCMGNMDIQEVYRCMGPYSNVGMYGGIQTYRGNTDVWRCTDVWGCTDVEVIQTPPYIQTFRHTLTCLPTTPGYYISYKI